MFRTPLSLAGGLDLPPQRSCLSFSSGQPQADGGRSVSPELKNWYQAFPGLASQPAPADHSSAGSVILEGHYLVEVETMIFLFFFLRGNFLSAGGESPGRSAPPCPLRAGGWRLKSMLHIPFSAWKILGPIQIDGREDRRVRKFRDRTKLFVEGASLGRTGAARPGGCSPFRGWEEGILPVGSGGDVRQGRLG